MKKYSVYMLLPIFFACSSEKTETVAKSNNHSERVDDQIASNISEPTSIIQPAQENVGPETTQFPEASPGSNYSFNVISSEGNTYGYEILKEGKPMIRQINIPGLPGNKGFESKDAAEKVAEVVIQKLKQGEMPPTVSIAEMKQLQVIK